MEAAPGQGRPARRPAAELGAGTIHVAAIGKQMATIAHANNEQTDRSFRLAVIG
jgi:hypothetical protein